MNGRNCDGSSIFHRAEPCSCFSADSVVKKG
jgi:hypothetical protein